MRIILLFLELVEKVGVHGMDRWRAMINLEVCVYRWQDEGRERLWIYVIHVYGRGFV